jgi:uncharacterized RmlC-like cupin family protein
VSWSGPAGRAGAQGFDYFEGISAQSAGARGICMHLLTIPPGAAAQPHLHEDDETAIYVLSGRAQMRYGERLAEELEVTTGEFLYIPAGMPHLPYNASDAEASTALLAPLPGSTVAGATRGLITPRPRAPPRRRASPSRRRPGCG